MLTKEKLDDFRDQVRVMIEDDAERQAADQIRKGLRSAVLNPWLIESFPYTGVCYAAYEAGNAIAFGLCAEFAQEWPCIAHHNYRRGFIDDPHIGMTLNRLQFIQQVCRAIDTLLDE